MLRFYLSDRYQRVLIYNSSSNNTTFSEWGKIKHCVPQGSILGPLFFLLYINDHQNIADDTSVIIANFNPSKFKDDINSIIDDINDWFKNNSLSLSFYKTYSLQFRPKIRYETNLKITCDNIMIKETKTTKFFGLDIDSSLSWKDNN